MTAHLRAILGPTDHDVRRPAGADGSAGHRWRRPLALGLTLLGFLVGIYYIWSLGFGRPVDAQAYYLTAPSDPYRSSLSLETPSAYLYSPVFAQAMGLLQHLSLVDFLTLFRLTQLVALGALTGPAMPAIVFWSPVASEINAGNIHLFLGVAIVAGFRWPALWSFVLLTKVTPGIGLLWFAVRGEWRSLGVALGATAGVVVASVLLFGLDPWLQWVRVLAANGGLSHDATMILPFPIWLRLAAAAVLIVWGARTDRRSVVPIACLIALPWVWYHALSMTLAALPLAWREWTAASKAPAPPNPEGRLTG